MRSQAQRAVTLSAEFGILKQPEITWSAFIAQISEDYLIGSEHIIELDPQSGLVGKTTQPSGFGLIPEVLRLPKVKDLRNPGPDEFREVIEFFPATPLEYLSRWLTSNEVFGDDVRLVSVIQWSEGEISMGITQPQYHGTPADPRDIEAFFNHEGWKRLNDPSGHTIFYNCVFDVIAIDAESRNCYITEFGLQPFDVILRVPDDRLERFLKIY